MAPGVGNGTVLIFALQVGLLLTEMLLAFVALLVPLLFAPGRSGPMSIPLISG